VTMGAPRRAALAALLVASAAGAEVTESSPSGFHVRHELALAAPPATAWNALATPGQWWPEDHTWSGHAKKLTLELSAGGCFCERWDGGSAAHGRVLMVRDRELLRMDAPLGPLQQMGISGLLTVTLEAGGKGTKAVVTFRASGDASHGLDKLAPVVDRVVGEQWGRWVAYANGLAEPPGERPPPDIN
jgi:uncharacterized protein YndB with AHSA1/START domain